MLIKFLNHHHILSRSSRYLRSTMVKRSSSTLEVEETASTVRRSTRVTKKAKVTVSEDQIVEQLEVNLVEEKSSKKKGKAKASVGAHVSAAGGVENSVLNAAKIGANAFALFLKSQRKWVSPALKESSIVSFKTLMKEHSYSPKQVLPHGSYLINLGNPDAEKREQSYTCFLDDLKRCDALGLELYNFHPGSTLGIVEPSVSMTHIAESINRAHRDTPGSKVVVVLENMAGSGNVIGSDFAQLGEIIRQVEDKSRVGVCLDTCHMFAAGYDIRSRDGWNVTVQSFDTNVGLEYLRGMHLNDSKTECGSKKDRHDNLGVGHLSIQAFAHILTDPRMQDIPLILETPSHEETSKNWNVWSKEIEVLNGLSSGETDLDSLMQDIRDVIKAAGGGKAKAKKAPARKGKRGKKSEEAEESEEEEG
ncbi:AP endonuclease [Gymnopus androsaceus JB14]|uniref:Apurinic-apyrimidinic endonuclease 1 n=1 Tax=Gymnopus androsaceus JB14 TaxID=1447944 RepID=A0A6A4IH98_9AGAR|nr:AP endonuclease [Gymnopus androsaceus JB14]